MEWPIVLGLAIIVLGPPALLLVVVYGPLCRDMSLSHRQDFLVGLFSAIFINVLLCAAIWCGKLWAERSSVNIPERVITVILVAPWVVNGALLVLALLLRPYVAIGYVGSIGFIVAWVVGLFCLVGVGCVVLIVIAAVSIITLLFAGFGGMGRL